MEQSFVSIVKTTEDLHLVLSKDTNGQWNVQGWHSKKEALAYYENGYQNFHKRDYQSSMSACINWMSFQPSIVALTLDEIKELVSDMQRHSLRNIAGGFDGIQLKPEAVAIWENGAKPRLIHDEESVYA